MAHAQAAPIKIPVYDRQGKELESLAVEASVFGGAVRRVLLKQVLLAYEANLRHGNHDTKGKGEVAFSKKKPWAQKKTGRARAGQRGSPLWRKGGVIFGPTPRSYRQGLTDQMRFRALQSAVLAKLKDSEVKVVSDLDSTQKTKEVASILKSLKIERGCLIGTPAVAQDLWRTSRNIPRVTVKPVGEWNALEVLRHRQLLLTRDGWNSLVEYHRSRS